MTPDMVDSLHSKNKKILIVGSWAKEQITMENIKQRSDVQAFAYMDTKNPGIISIADGYRIGKLHDINSIVDYAKENNFDLVLPTTASPLALGLVDKLRENNISAFGPSKKAAKLESDKGYSRQLMQSYGIDALPRFQVFEDAEEAIRFCKQLSWKIAVKPTGLTEGLGVRVYGEQLLDKDEVIEYIYHVFNQKKDNNTRVLIEEKIEGVEFTIQCLVNGKLMVSTPAVQDFKKLLPGDKGPNTASMGSYADKDFLLPFLDEEIYDQAVEIMKKTLHAFYKETGELCQGFLYGQFMITKHGLKLIEYNFRPGDPEWMNTLTVLSDNVLDIIERVMNGKQRNICFEGKATVCKYIVPKKYPKKLNQLLDVFVDEKKIRNIGVDMYYSCGFDNQNRLNVGSERGIAFIAKGDTIYDAVSRVEKAISQVEGDFNYRKDIGTKKQIEKNIRKVNKIKKEEIVIENAAEEDFLEVYDFVSKCDFLEDYYEHFYKIMLRYFDSTCFIARYNHKMVGFNLGFVSQMDKNTFFIWQIGVDSSMRRKGVGRMLLEKIEKTAKKMGCNRIELTIDPENNVSRKFFKRRGYVNISSKEGKTVEVKGVTAVKDYYKPGRHFILVEKKI